jgi:hypothetical protein
MEDTLATFPRQLQWPRIYNQNSLYWVMFIGWWSLFFGWVPVYHNSHDDIIEWHQRLASRRTVKVRDLVSQSLVSCLQIKLTIYRSYIHHDIDLMQSL